MNCSEAADFIAFIPQRIIIAMQIFLSILSIAVNLLFIKYCKRDLFFHRNCRILLWTVIAANILHSVFLGILQVSGMTMRCISFPELGRAWLRTSCTRGGCAFVKEYCGSERIGTHFVKILTSTTPCDVLVPPLFCFLLRLLATMSFMVHATIHFAMVVERGIATKRMDTYENSNDRIGYIMAIISVVVAVAIAYYCMHEYSLTDVTFYCSAATPTTMDDVSLASIFVVFMEAVILVMFVLIYIWNVRRERSVYDLRTKYQNRENIVVLRLLMPMVLLHFVIYSCFMVASAIAPSIRDLFNSPSSFRAYVSSVYIVPFYTVISPLLLWWIVKHHRKVRGQQLNHMSVKAKDENDIYFTNYAAAWNQK